MMNFEIINTIKGRNVDDSLLVYDCKEIIADSIIAVIEVIAVSNTYCYIDDKSGQKIMNNIYFYINDMKNVNVTFFGKLIFNEEFNTLVFEIIEINRNMDQPLIDMIYSVEINSTDIEYDPKSLFIELESLIEVPDNDTNDNAGFRKSKDLYEILRPYEYYVDLKENLIRENFLLVETGNRRSRKVILLSNEDYEFYNFKNNGKYIWKGYINKVEHIVIDYNQNHEIFNNIFLKSHVFNMQTKIQEYDPLNTSFNKEHERLFKTISRWDMGNASLYSSNKFFNIDEIIKTGKLMKSAEQHDLITLFLTQPKESYSNAIENNDKLIELGNEISELYEKLFSYSWSSKLFSDFALKDLIWNIHKFVTDCKLLIDSNINKNITLKEGQIDNYNKLISYCEELINMDVPQIENISISIQNRANEKMLKIISLKEEELKELSLKRIDYRNLANGKPNKQELLAEIEKLYLEKLEERENYFNDLMNNKWNDFKNEVFDELDIKSETISKISEIAGFLKKTKLSKLTYIRESNFITNSNSGLIFDNDYLYIINMGEVIVNKVLRDVIDNAYNLGPRGKNIIKKITNKMPLNIYKDKINKKDMQFIPNTYGNLNESQKFAFRLSIDQTDQLSLIQGPPGTGKTEVIKNIIKFYRNKGIKTIITSQTNIAIKNVVDKLSISKNLEDSIFIPWLTMNKNEEHNLDNLKKTLNKNFFKVIRNVESDNELLHKWRIDSKELDRDNTLFDNFDLRIFSSAIAATTTTSLTNKDSKNYSFISNAGVLIIDEVTKSILPEILRYAMFVDKIILVGDYKQLNPILDISPEDFKFEIDMNEFNKLKDDIDTGIFFRLVQNAIKMNRVASLNVNYRSLPGVLDSYNVFYDTYGNSKTQALENRRSFDEFPSLYNFNKSKYFDLNHTTYFFDILDSKESRIGTSRINKNEISILIVALHDLANSLENSEEKSVAIIIPYAAQISYFERLIKQKNNRILFDKFNSLKWDTVDSFQGSESDIIFLSTVVTDTESRNFLQDYRRVNVSMSRAKDMLIIFGKGDVLRRIEVSGQGIKSDKYFLRILDDKVNKYLKVITIDTMEVQDE